MTVLFVTHVPQMGGANRAMYQLIKELKMVYGIKCIVLVPDIRWDGVGVIEENLREIDVSVVKGPIEWFKIKSTKKSVLLGALKYHLEYLWGQRNFYKQLTQYNVDIVHSNSSVIDVGGYLSCQLGAKHVWHLREMADIHYGMYSVGGSLYERFTYSHADALVAISESVAKHFSSRVPRTKIRVIYDGVVNDTSSVQSIHDNDVCQYICAGNISNGKNQIEIVRAANELRNRGFKDFHITLVGHNDEPCTSIIRKVLNEYNCTDFFTIMPEQDGINHLLPHMDVGIIASKYEAFGLANIEFQLQNLLVIGNDSGATPELLKNGENGLIYHLGDYKGLADKMQMAIENRELMISLAAKGRQYAREHFTSKKNTEQIYELYKELMSKSR